MPDHPCRPQLPGPGAALSSRSTSASRSTSGAYSDTGTLAWKAEPYALRRNRTKRKAVIPPHDKSCKMVREVSVHKLIRRALRDHYAAVMAEPIPQHWVDMLNRLAERESKTRQAPTKQDPEFGNSMS